MKKSIVLALALVLTAVPAFAQLASATSRLGFDTPTQDASVASQAVFKAYIDGATLPVTLSDVQCVSLATGATCSSAFPALTPGKHTLTITETLESVESAPSVAFAFSFVVVVTPTNIRVIRK